MGGKSSTNGDTSNRSSASATSSTSYSTGHGNSSWTACSMRCGRLAVNDVPRPVCNECYRSSASHQRPASTSYRSSYGSTLCAPTLCAQACGSAALPGKEFCHQCYENYKQILCSSATGSSRGTPDNGGTSLSTQRHTTTASSTKLTNTSTRLPCSSTTISKKSPSNPQSTGGARPKDPGSSKKVEGIRDNLLCPIHLDLVERAKTLPCQHFMCEECLKKWVASRGDLKCPTCNTIHDLPYGGVSQLPDNFVINNLVAEMRKLDMDAGEDEGQDEGSQRVASSSSRIPQRAEPAYTNPYSGRKVPHAGRSILTKLGNKMAVVKGSPIKLTLTLCDEEGSHMRGTQREKVEGIIHTPQEDEPLSITDIAFKKRDGDYWISFSPEEVGVHQLEVFLNGEMVQGCPMKVVVRPNTTVLRRVFPGFIDKPRGVLSTTSYIYVAEASNGAYKCMNSSGEMIGFPGLPDSLGDVSPFGITMLNSKLLITDLNNNCVYVYDTGIYKQKFGMRVLESPTGIAVSQSGMIYVANMLSSAIDIFRPNYSHEGTINIRGNRKQSLAMLAINRAEDKLIVADEEGEAIQIVDVQRRRVGKIINVRIQQAPAKPFGVSVDEDDNIYVSVTYDPARKKATDHATGGGRRAGAIIVYNSNGYFLGTMGDNELQNPRGICFIDEPSPQLMVVDDCGVTEDSCLKFFRV